MNPASARLRLIAVAALGLAPLLLSLALWISQDNSGFLAVAIVFATMAFVAYLALRGLPAALARASESAQSARRELAQTQHEAHAAVDTVSRAAAGLMGGNRSLSERTDGQASAIEQAAASIEQLAQGVIYNTETARKTQCVANLASEATGKGILAATMLIAHMESISEATAKVAEIVGVIDAIALQTDLLALNAAVEAAHAGEQGRGFTVVAAEVRSLSQRCAGSAREIRELVSSASSQVLKSTDVVDEVAEAMAAINARVAEVNQLMTAIVDAGAEQSAGVVQVERTITQMERATQQNAALVGEIVTATESLTAETSHLAALVQVSIPERVDPEGSGSADVHGARLMSSHPALRAK